MHVMHMCACWFVFLIELLLLLLLSSSFLFFSFCRSVPPELLQSFFSFFGAYLPSFSGNFLMSVVFNYLSSTCDLVSSVNQRLEQIPFPGAFSSTRHQTDLNIIGRLPGIFLICCVFFLPTFDFFIFFFQQTADRPEYNWLPAGNIGCG